MDDNQVASSGTPEGEMPGTVRNIIAELREVDGDYRLSDTHFSVLWLADRVDALTQAYGYHSDVIDQLDQERVRLSAALAEARQGRIQHEDELRDFATWFIALGDGCPANRGHVAEAVQAIREFRASRKSTPTGSERNG